MSSERIVDLARSLKLAGLAEAYRHQIGQPASLAQAFDERLTQLLLAEELARSDNRRLRLQQAAHFREDARAEDYRHQSGRGVDRQVMTELYSCAWVKRFENIVLNGAAGVGKTWIACSLGHAAIRHGHSCAYFRVDDLVEAIESARLGGTWVKFRKSLAKLSVLILDDFALHPLGEQAEADLFRVIEPRIGTASTIIAGQLALDQWATRIANPHLADAIMDRFNTRSHKLDLKGDSNR